MAFRPAPAPNDVCQSNFIDLAVNFDTDRKEAESLLAQGMSMDDIREYKRVLNGHGSAPLQ